MYGPPVSSQGLQQEGSCLPDHVALKEQVGHRVDIDRRGGLHGGEGKKCRGQTGAETALQKQPMACVFVWLTLSGSLLPCTA